MIRIGIASSHSALDDAAALFSLFSLSFLSLLSLLFDPLMPKTGTEPL